MSRPAPLWGPLRCALLLGAAGLGLLGGCSGAAGSNGTGVPATPGTSSSGATSTPGATSTGGSDAVPSRAAYRPIVQPRSTGEVVGIGTVVESSEGTVLCLSAVRDSLPPQCDGVPLKGWSWTTSPPARTAGGVRFETYAVTGTYDGSSFTLTRPAVLATEYRGYRPPVDDLNPTAPCPVPARGWPVPSARTWSESSQEKALAKASTLAGYAGAWIDDISRTPTDPATARPTGRGGILVVRVTRGEVEAEKAMRTVWGGPLCVAKVAHSTKALELTQTALVPELYRTLGSLTSQVDLFRNLLIVNVAYDDGSIQAEFDRRYGAGFVLVRSALWPLSRNGPGSG